MRAGAPIGAGDSWHFDGPSCSLSLSHLSTYYMYICTHQSLFLCQPCQLLTAAATQNWIACLLTQNLWLCLHAYGEINYYNGRAVNLFTFENQQNIVHVLHCFRCFGFSLCKKEKEISKENATFPQLNTFHAVHDKRPPFVHQCISSDTASVMASTAPLAGTVLPGKLFIHPWQARTLGLN